MFDSNILKSVYDKLSIKAKKELDEEWGIDSLTDLQNRVQDDILENDGETIYIAWNIMDVLEQAKNNDIELTTQEAKDVLALQYRKHDAEQGVSWDSLDYWIDEVVREREVK